MKKTTTQKHKKVCLSLKIKKNYLKATQIKNKISHIEKNKIKKQSQKIISNS